MQFLASNGGSEALFPGMCTMQPHEIVELRFGPGPFREMVENWPDVVWAGVAGLRREATRSSDPQLLDRL